jgi:hypothetical protein
MSSASTAAAAAKSCLLWLPYGVRCLLRIAAAAASAAFLAELLKGLVLGGYCRRVMRVCEYREYQAGCVYFTKASGEGVQCERVSWAVHPGVFIERAGYASVESVLRLLCIG